MTARYSRILFTLLFKNLRGSISSYLSKSSTLRHRTLFSAALATPLILGTTKPVLCYALDNQKTCDIMCRFCRFSNISELARMIKSGADVDCKHSLGWSPIHTAVANGNIE
ncbi:hypothetical protein RF11_07130 [Thelohanellus kitauei]|uniref:Uncharacterized protein n=1 Tax=Thelohanellus kitauei TaxID=669202 RepID=A0A0C2IXE7_THEKT|nr:hypothetical protein RF11_07130 [Thelohanellus kitauei]